MKFTASKKLKGFSLVELLVVMAIGIALFSTLGAGIIYLQNSVQLDNAVRDLKAEIQSAQNNARNSFVVNESASIQSTLGSKKLSVGWIVEMRNSNNNVLITKRSVYFLPGNSYNYTDLRTHIEQNIKNKSADFFCKNDVLYFKSASTQGTVSFPGTNNETLKCSSDNDERIETKINSIELTESNNGINNCYKTDVDGGKKVSIFFTSGYGETVFSNGNQNSNCQIQIKNANGVVTNARAIYISQKTGSLGTCGSYCVNDEITVIPGLTSFPATPINICSQLGGACGGKNSCCSGLSCLGNTCIDPNVNSCALINQTCGGSVSCCGGLSCNSGICKVGTGIPGPGPNPL